MNQCCQEEHQSGSSCPICCAPGNAVQRVTLESLLRAPSQIATSNYRFCPTRDCRVVYFSEDGRSVFRRADLTVRVGVKETEDPVPLCYCFGWDRARIRKEIRETGRSTAVQSISAEVKAGRCFCERSNPQGSCCLGTVQKAVQEGFKQHGQADIA